jgi:type IV secretion system protein TrbL
MEFNTLTATLNQFIRAFEGGFGALVPASQFVLHALLVIELTLGGLWVAMDGSEALSSLFRKVLYLSVWVWFVGSFQDLSGKFVKSLIRAGLLAGGRAGEESLLFDPSRIAGYGLDATKKLAEEIMNASILTIMGGTSVFLVCFLVILGCFLFLALQVFLAVLEYYLLLALVVILMPFGIFGPTKFISEKAIGAVVASGIKLMVLAFLIAVVDPVLAQIRLVPHGVNLTVNEVLSVSLTVGGITLLCWHAPSLATGLLAGSPSLTLGTAAQSAVAGVRGAASGSHALSAVRTAAAAFGGRVAVGAAAAVGAVAGVGSAAVERGGGVRGAAGALGGAAGAAGGALLRSATGPVRNAAAGIGEAAKGAFDMGKWAGMPKETRDARASSSPSPKAPPPGPGKGNGGGSAAGIREAAKGGSEMGKWAGMPKETRDPRASSSPAPKAPPPGP